MIGIIKVVSAYTFILFDLEATHSFISSRFARKSNIMSVPLAYKLCVSTPNGSVIMVHKVCPLCFLSIRDHNLVSNLIVLEMDFDVNLGMDCLLHTMPRWTTLGRE